jgi:cytoskeletal protein CcmA (bactofilin family)
MKKQSNFMKAVEELMDGQFSASRADKQDSPEAGGPASPAAGMAGMPESVTARPQDFGAPGIPSTLRRLETNAAEAVITEDMVIKGTITATANICISGSVVGDVTSEGDIFVKGKIEGNVSAHSLTVQEGAVTGDVEAKGTVIVAENSSVAGNVKAERIEVNGKIVGNLDSSAKIVLQPKSDIEGDIAAAELSMSEGAQLKGSVNVHRTA